MNNCSQSCARELFARGAKSIVESGCPDYFLPESQSVVGQFDIIEGDGPEVKVNQGGIREATEVGLPGASQFLPGRIADGAGELGAANTAHTHCLKGDGACHLGVAAKLRTVPCGRVGGDNKRILLLIPGKEARCAPRTLLADGGDAQQVMAPQQRPYSFVKFLLCHLVGLMVKPICLGCHPHST